MTGPHRDTVEVAPGVVARADGVTGDVRGRRGCRWSCCTGSASSARSGTRSCGGCERHRWRCSTSAGTASPTPPRRGLLGRRVRRRRPDAARQPRLGAGHRRRALVGRGRRPGRRRPCAGPRRGCRPRRRWAVGSVGARRSGRGPTPADAPGARHPRGRLVGAHPTGRPRATWSDEVQAALAPTFVTDESGNLRTRIGMDRHLRVLDGLLDHDAAADLGLRPRARRPRLGGRVRARRRDDRLRRRRRLARGQGAWRARRQPRSRTAAFTGGPVPSTTYPCSGRHWSPASSTPRPRPRGAGGRDRARRVPGPGRPGHGRRLRGMERRRRRRVRHDRAPARGVGRAAAGRPRLRGVLRLPGQPAATSASTRPASAA